VIQFEDTVRLAIDECLARGVDYADARWIDEESERVLVKDGKVEGIVSSHSKGIGIRILWKGAWGFAGVAETDKDSVRRAVARAFEIARASATAVVQPARLAPCDPVVAEYSTAFKIDPFQVPLEEKLSLLLDADQAMRQAAPVRVTQGHFACRREEKVFASTEGAFITQHLLETGAGIEATAVEGSEVQMRAYPSSHGGDWAKKGYELVQEMDLVRNASQIAEEAHQLLSARQCPPKQTTLVIGGAQMALQVHESCGHPIELDRVLGTEAGYAGTSFLTPDKLGGFRYGSPAVNIFADATVEGGLGTFGFDDEGVPAQRIPIVKEGIFSGYLTSRETAAQIGLERSGGAMRADGWSRIPLIRMTNINLEPGDWSLEEMLSEVKEGLFLDFNKSWSIDDKRLNFQFGTQLAREIVNGELGDLVKNVTYTGITPDFWCSCDAVGDKSLWHVWGVPNCGKGEPVQTARVGHGTSPARFRNVRVGLMK